MSCVTVWDPANKWKRYRQDALGRLMEVEEPRPGGGVYTTSHAYNGLDRLTQVRRFNGTAEYTCERQVFVVYDRSFDDRQPTPKIERALQSN